MKTIILNKPGDFSLIETEPAATLADGEALLKIHRVGICGTDLHAFAGNQPFFSYPRILGHELGVEVVSVAPDVQHVKPGDRCSVEPYRNPTLDQAVRRGKTNCGENLSVLGVHEDGGMREYLRFPAKYLHKSSVLTYDQLALVETLGIGCHAVNRARVSASDLVLVIGAGPIGLGTIQFARAAGAQVVVMDVNNDRLDFCVGQMGVSGTVNPTEGDPEKLIRSSFGGDLPTVVFDATGNRHSMAKAIEYVAFGGIVVFIGLYIGDYSFHDPYFHRKEMTLMASRNSQSHEFVQIIDMIEKGRISTDPWITHRAGMQEMIGVFPDWIDPGNKVIKAVLEVC
ncbi:MAG: zinc-binding alcohol dehydrogenase family protein [Bacteroidia bacterium]